MPESVWLRPPEDLVEIGFERSRVVMMNEAHDGLRALHPDPRGG
jgi:hypothetical protein